MLSCKVHELDKLDDEMPQIVHCDECDAVLYEGFELKPPYEILELHEGACPKCNRKLASTPIRVQVKRLRGMKCDINSIALELE